MIPKPTGPYAKYAKYFLLEQGDVIEETDEYYNPIMDKWLPVQKDFIGYEFDPEESKPVRRKNINRQITAKEAKALKSEILGIESNNPALN